MPRWPWPRTWPGPARPPRKRARHQGPLTPAPDAALAAQIDQRAKAIEDKLIAWRRDIHQHPELGNQETRTAKLVADHLRALGMEVKTGVAVTGVVAVLKGGKPGPVVALRADMDAAGEGTGGPALRVPGQGHLPGQKWT